MSVLHQQMEKPLNKLVLWDGNVRKTGSEAGIEELAASIESHGLLNPLTIASGPKGKFVVIAGGRRLRALKLLAKAGKLAKTAEIACQMADDAADAAELSLAENVVRVAMHPADQFEAWRRLAEKGHEAAGIAERFGVAESTVRKRLALGRVSPVILEAYREGDIDLEALQAFTVTDDHARQEGVWQGLTGWQRNDGRTIKLALTEGDVPTSDRRVRLIGLDAYEAAGGTVKRDLFACEGGGYCVDVALLDRLTREKLEAVAAEVKAEGWSWVDARLSFSWDERMAFEEAEPEGDDEDEEAEARWSDEVKAKGGAVVYLGYEGAQIDRGLIRADETPEEAEEPDEEAEAPEGGKVPVLPASLIEDLTAHRTAALRVELARRPDIALAVTVHAVAASVFYFTGERGLKGGLSVRNLERSMQDHNEAPAVMAFSEELDRMRDRLPGNPGDFLQWCLSASRDELLDVLAIAIAHGVDAVVTKADPNRSGVAFGTDLAKAVGLDIASWYAPTAKGYFSRIPKALILSDLEAAKGVPPAPAWAKLKKTELAALAERECAGLSWLPEPLR